MTTIFCTAVIYCAIWPYFLVHLFFRHRGQQAIYHAIVPKNIIKGPLLMLSFINSEALCKMGAIIFALGIILLIKKKKSNENINSYIFNLFMVGVFYLFVVGTIAPFMDSRYIMPVSWIFVLAGYLTVRRFFMWLIKGNVIDYVMLFVFPLAAALNLNLVGCKLPHDYYRQGIIDTMHSLDNHDVLVYLDEEWKPIIFFEELQHAKSYRYIDEQNAQSIFDSMKKDYYILCCVEPEDENKLLENLDAELIYSYSGRSYYHVNCEK